MAAFEKHVLVHAPIETVFRYLVDPHNLPEFWTNVMEVSNVHRLPHGERKFDWEYKMVGVRLEGVSEETDFAPYEHFTHTLKGGLQGEIKWLFEKEEEGTRVSIVCDYQIPLPLLKKHSEDVIMRQNEHDMDAALRNMKWIMEHVPVE